MTGRDTVSITGPLTHDFVPNLSRFIFESRSCACGRLHGMEVILGQAEINAYPELARWTLESAFDALVRAMAECGAGQ